MVSFDPVSQKMQHARENFAEFQKRFDQYAGTDCVTIIHDYEAGSGLNTYTFKVLQQPPPKLALLMGDVLSAARGALDYLVWQLVLLEGEFPTRANRFPVLLKEVSWPGALKRGLKGVGAPWVQKIELLQPYWDTTPEQHPLAQLDRLNNVIKHRTVPLSAQIAGKVTFQNLPLRPGDKVHPPSGHQYVDGSIVLAIETFDRRQVESFSVKEISLRIGFDADGRSQWDTLPVLDWIQQALEEFKPAFA